MAQGPTTATKTVTTIITAIRMETYKVFGSTTIILGRATLLQTGTWEVTTIVIAIKSQDRGGTASV